MALTLATLDKKLGDLIPRITGEVVPTDAELKTVARVYCDGGVIGANPSVSGGTWAFVLTDPDFKVIHAGAGLTAPTAYGKTSISNNVTELLALAHGLTSVPEGASVDIFTDSQITLKRGMHARHDWTSWEGIHPDLKAWVCHGVQKLGQARWTLLAGHPTEADLARGYKVKAKNPSRQWPVSEFNVLCDLLCQREAVLWRACLESAVLEHVVEAEVAGDIAKTVDRAGTRSRERSHARAVAWREAQGVQEAGVSL